ncbi:hypothetical protein [Polaromonas sp.]|uniref:hypothetical protein n=1 Tax=Polaromonas sp. TaxID=1869339 RepID=UPI00286B77D2|nr:hypothetical protein [Polaromonas sp.]
MRKLWTNYAEVLEFAKSHSRALEQPILIQRIHSGWILPDYVAYWNGFSQDADTESDPGLGWSDQDNTERGSGSSGMSSTCGESLMDGYQQFSGEISNVDPEDSENSYRDE